MAPSVPHQITVPPNTCPASGYNSTLASVKDLGNKTRKDILKESEHQDDQIEEYSSDETREATGKNNWSEEHDEDGSKQNWLLSLF